MMKEIFPSVNIDAYSFMSPEKIKINLDHSRSNFSVDFEVTKEFEFDFQSQNQIQGIKRSAVSTQSYIGFTDISSENFQVSFVPFSRIRINTDSRGPHPEDYEKDYSYFDANRIVFETAAEFFKNWHQNGLIPAAGNLAGKILKFDEWYQLFNNFADSLMDSFDDIINTFGTFPKNYAILNLSDYASNFGRTWKNLGQTIVKTYGNAGFWKDTGLDILKKWLNSDNRIGLNRGSSSSILKSQSKELTKKGVVEISNYTILRTPAIQRVVDPASSIEMSGSFKNAASLLNGLVPDFMTNMYTAFFCFEQDDRIVKDLASRKDKIEDPVGLEKINPMSTEKDYNVISDLSKIFNFETKAEYYRNMPAIGGLKKFFKTFYGNDHALNGLERTLGNSGKDLESMFAVRLQGIKIPERRQNIFYIDVPMTKVPILGTDMKIDHSFELTVDLDQNLFMMDAFNLLAGNYQTLYNKYNPYDLVIKDNFKKFEIKDYHLDINRYLLEFFPAVYRLNNFVRLHLIVDVNNNYGGNRQKGIMAISSNTKNGYQFSPQTYKTEEGTVEENRYKYGNKDYWGANVLNQNILSEGEWDDSAAFISNEKWQKPVTVTGFRYIFEDCKCLGQTSDLQFSYDDANVLTATFRFTFKRMVRDFYSTDEN